MPDHDAGNTSNARNKTRNLSTLQLVSRGGAVAMALFEFFVLAEILWYYLHDGEQTLHGAIKDYLSHLSERAERRASFAAEAEKVREQIRNLPETE